MVLAGINLMIEIPESGNNLRQQGIHEIEYDDQC